MSKNSLYLRVVRQILPSPFSIAVILTLLTFILALAFTDRPENAGSAYSLVILGYWEIGFWELLEFTMQMALILILGHALALTPFVNSIIDRFTVYCNTSAKAAFTISLLTILVSMINWGLCLVFGAIFARKVAERAKANGWKMNYPLLGAAGYSGMMCFHGGFSGSAPLAVASNNHFLIQEIGQIGIGQTILSTANIITFVLLLIIIPSVFYLLGKRSHDSEINIVFRKETHHQEEKGHGAERMDNSKIAAIALGGLICFIAIRKMWVSPALVGLSFIDLNYINFFFFGLAILLHGSFAKFLSAIEEAIGGSAGIIIQFPLYAGIMGIMTYSGLGALFSQGFMEISNATTLPIFTFFSAAIVNIFVPSGGGQWVVQGPIVTEAAQNLGASIPKTIMALSYGDQLTNMLQPFWALPLLGITKLKAKDILPYSFIIMLVGMAIFLLSLLVF
ncbi:short-chain fatty acid transporter [Roseivirga echinicomitans]|uniref:Short chain fatty acid transporter n=1 Tax=Roseivirga echinicomitans TaxID=296218 RepID=A0A150X2I7_9BACT|nr:TIGR00366 family protein [Roseivirga echinicomitans]KYG72939.1 short chain fatty acid transporter [Roseivirga echinicomitans]